MHVASLGRRAGAVGLDYLVISVYLVLLVAAGVGLRAAAPDVAGTLFGGPLVGELTAFLALTLPVALYFAFTESSRAAASWGKRRLGLRVAANGEEGPGLGRSLLRSAVKFLPWELAHAAIWQFQFTAADAQLLPMLLLAACWVLVAANVATAVLQPRHRAIHDLVAGTTVVRASA